MGVRRLQVSEPDNKQALRLLEALFKASGAVLVRSKKHYVYRFPTGKIYVVPGTPSCPFAYTNCLKKLRRMLPELLTPGQH